MNAALPPYSGWWVVPIGDGDMQEVNLWLFTRFGILLRALESVEPRQKVDQDFLMVLALLGQELKWFRNVWVVPYRICEKATEELEQFIGYLRHDSPGAPQPGETLRSVADSIRIAVQKFESVLANDLERKLDVYAMRGKLGYGTRQLIDDATFALSPLVQACISPEAKLDIQEAGRCAVFNRPTAAAFHIFRATERFLRQYYAVVTKSVTPPKSRDWGAYVRNLRKCPDANPELLDDLDRVRSRFRNPIIHPEVFVTESELQPLFDRCKVLMHDIVVDVGRLWH